MRVLCSSICYVHVSFPCCVLIFMICLVVFSKCIEPDFSLMTFILALNMYVSVSVVCVSVSVSMSVPP